jgi:hypothetical protein
MRISNKGRYLDVFVDGAYAPRKNAVFEYHNILISWQHLSPKQKLGVN